MANCFRIFIGALLLLLGHFGLAQQTTNWTSVSPSVWQSVTDDGLVRVECRVTSGVSILGNETMGCTDASTYSDEAVFESPSLEIEASSVTDGTLEFVFFDAVTGNPVHIVNPVLHADKVGTFELLTIIPLFGDAATANFNLTNGTWTELSSNGPIFQSTINQFNIDDETLLIGGGGECGNGTNTGSGGGSMQLNNILQSINMDVELTGGLLGLATASDDVEFVLTNLIIADPIIEVTKTAVENFTDPVSVGNTIDYVIEISNTGNVTIDNIALSDTFTDANTNNLSLTSDPAFSNSSLGSSEGTLLPGETATYLANFALNNTAVEVGGVINQVRALGDSPFGVDDVFDLSDDGVDTDGNIENDPTESFFPVTNDDSADVCEVGSVDINVLGNDNFGGNGPDSGTIFLVTNAGSGTATINDNGTPTTPTDDYITYTSATGFTGSDSFTYGIRDAKGYTQHATVAITETPNPDAGIDGTLIICEGENVTEAQLFTQLGGTPDSGGTWSPAMAGAGTYTYTIESSYCEDVFATVTVTEESQPNAGTDATIAICPNSTVTETQLFSLLNTNDTRGIWSPNPNGAGAGIYSYSISGSICSGSSVARVTVVISNLDSDGDTILDCNENVDRTDPFNDCESVDGKPIATSDCDEDELTEEEENLLGTDPRNPDTDGDGVIDGHEINDITDPLDPCDFLLISQTLEPSDEWKMMDCDMDGLTNEQEIERKTDLTNPDTDGDSIKDGQEVNDNTDPLDACDSLGGTAPPNISCELFVELDLVKPGDILNGSFVIINIDRFPDNTVEIYNRWGILVWETTGYDNENNAFDGLSKGRITIMENQKLPSGVYFYEIKYVSDGMDKVKSGYLYVMR